MRDFHTTNRFLSATRDRAEKRLRMRHSSVNGNVGSGARGLKWLRFASKLFFGIQT